MMTLQYTAVNTAN